MNPGQGAMLAALVGCVALSAFFSASETAYAAANRVKLKTRAQNGERRAETALRLSENYDRLLTTLLVGNNVVNIAAATIATVLCTSWMGEIGPTVSTIALTLIILLFGEISPKTLAKRAPEQTAMTMAPVLKYFVTVLGTLDALLVLWRRMLARLFPAKAEDTDIEDELLTMVDEAQSEGNLDAPEGELIRSALEFRDLVVEDIMTPRVDVTALEDTATVEEAGKLFRETAYSRIPVYHEDMDHIVGILHEKDYYVRVAEGAKSITDMVQEPVYAADTLSVSSLLKLFQSTKTHMVMVLDEFGGTEGVVTMEDALEELVGEIYDEHDDADDVNEEMVRQADGSWLVEGGMQLEKLLDQLKIRDEDYEADTAGGWAGEMLERIPTVGSSFKVEGWEVTVAAMDRLRVTRLRFRKLETQDSEKKSQKEEKEQE